MTATDDILKTGYCRFDESFFYIVAEVPRRPAVKRKIATLRADDEFFAGEMRERVAEFLRNSRPLADWLDANVGESALPARGR